MKTERLLKSWREKFSQKKGSRPLYTGNDHQGGQPSPLSSQRIHTPFSLECAVSSPQQHLKEVRIVLCQFFEKSLLTHPPNLISATGFFLSKNAKIKMSNQYQMTKCQNF
jgi:hypothetical protein